MTARRDPRPLTLGVDELRERLGSLVEKADNFVHSTVLPMPDRFHVMGLRGGMEELRELLKALYFECGGEDVWTD